MSYDLLGWRLVHTRVDADGQAETTRGRCRAVWGDGPYLRLALEQDDRELVLVCVGPCDSLEIAPGGRKVSVA